MTYPADAADAVVAVGIVVGFGSVAVGFGSAVVGFGSVAVDFGFVAADSVVDSVAVVAVRRPWRVACMNFRYC